MALTIAQIITLALQDANCPSYQTQGGQKLNLILQELGQDYNFSAAQGWWSSNFGVPYVGTTNFANLPAGAGPFALPADFQRFNFHDFFWQNGGINYFPTPYDIDEFDAFVQQPGFTSYPTAYSVDMSVSPPALAIWPASSGAYPCFGRYQRTMPDIATPETSSVVPWFPSQQYVLHRLTAEMMITTGDTRAGSMMELATDDLRKFIEMEGNRDTRAVTAKLDPRHFGTSWGRLRSTKIIPW